RQGLLEQLVVQELGFHRGDDPIGIVGRLQLGEQQGNVQGGSGGGQVEAGRTRVDPPKVNVVQKAGGRRRQRLVKRGDHLRLRVAAGPCYRRGGPGPLVVPSLEPESIGIAQYAYQPKRLGRRCALHYPPCGGPGCRGATAEQEGQ